MLRTVASGRTPRYGPTIRSRYSAAATSGSRFIASRRGTPGTPVGEEPSFTARTSSRFDAGSVLRSRTRRPLSAKAIAVADEIDVLPTPPFPVKNR